MGSGRREPGLELGDLAELELDRGLPTEDFTRERLSSTSSTMPLNEANGPSDTRTVSPTSKVTEALGCSTPSATCPLMRSASRSGIDIGLLSAPRKPVTFGVFLIRW